jgi:hypothetical protein
MAGRLHALLVGINAYPPPVPPLSGCVNDVDRMAEFLGHRAGDGDARIMTLKDEEATRQGVIDAFRGHLGTSGPDDVALFYFSGHGSQEPTPPELVAIEPDGLDETLVCQDSRLPGRFDLADKELGKLVSEVVARGAHVVVILDSCHSGTATRALGATVRRAPTDERRRPIESFIFAKDDAEELRRAAGARGAWALAPARHVLLAACRAEEEAKELPLEGERRGVFSYFLLGALQQAAETPSYRDLQRRVSAAVRGRVTQQWPDFEAVEPHDMDLQFLGGAVAPRPATVFVSRDPQLGWTMDAGAVHGIPRGTGEETTTLALFEQLPPAGQLRVADAVGTARVTEVLPDRSRVAIELRDGAPQPSAQYEAVVVGLPLPKLPVELQGDPADLKPLRDALETAAPDEQPSLYVAEADDGELRVVALSEGGQRYRIARSAEGRELVEDVEGFTAAAAEDVIDRLEHIARWTRLNELANPVSRLPEQAVRMRIYAVHPDAPNVLDELRPEDGEIVLTYRRDGDDETAPRIKIELENTTDEPLYCILLDLTETYGVYTTLLPASGELLPPRGRVWAYGNKPIPVTIPSSLADRGFVELKDQLKLIVSTERMDATALAERDLDVRSETRGAVEEAAPPAVASTLDRLMRRIALRHIGAEEGGDRLADWRTSSVGLTVQRPRWSIAVPDPGTTAELAPGVTLVGHPALAGTNARVVPAPHATRGLDDLPLPPILVDDPRLSQPFEFQQTRNGRPGPSALELELADPGAAEAVTPDAPLLLRVDGLLGEEEHVLPFAWDGEFFLPLGHARRQAGGTELVVERLPEPVAGTRDLKGSIRIFFQKVVGRKLGLTYEYPLLAAPETGPEGDITIVKDPDEIAARVDAAARILLFVHGIIGDTRAMAASARLRPDGDGAGPPLAHDYDLVLTFDYENINTPIQETARALGQRLRRAGLGPKHDKTLDVVAHSMGGLVSRWFVEREGGHEVVDHLVTAGTPHAGSPWPKLQDWATVAVSFALNNVAATFWPAAMLPGLLGLIEKVDVTLDQMAPQSDFLADLAASPDPGVRYTALAGNTSILPALAEGPELGRVGRLLGRLDVSGLRYRALGLAFFGAANDIAVSVASARDLPDGRDPEPAVHEVPCDHLTYFTSHPTLAAVAAALRIP